MIARLCGGLEFARTGAPTKRLRPIWRTDLGRNSVRVVQLFRARAAPRCAGPDADLLQPVARRGQAALLLSQRARPAARALAGKWRYLREAKIENETCQPNHARSCPRAPKQLNSPIRCVRVGALLPGEPAVPIETTTREGWRRVSTAARARWRSASRAVSFMRRRFGSWAFLSSLCALGAWCAGMMATRKS